MIAEGHIILFRFPQTDHSGGKLRPALIIRQLPGKYRDWLICMISTQLHQEIHDFDVVIDQADSDFRQSGLKQSSLIRISRLAVANEEIFLGKLGDIHANRLRTIKARLATWILPLL